MIRISNGLSGYVVEGDPGAVDQVAVASGADWEETLGEFKGVQRAINGYITAQVARRPGGFPTKASLVATDGAIGMATLDSLGLIVGERGLLTRGGGRYVVTLADVAKNPRYIAEAIGALGAGSPSYSPDRLATDYKGVAKPTRGAGTGAGAGAADDEEMTTSTKLFVAAAAVGLTYAGWRWWKRRG